MSLLSHGGRIVPILTGHDQPIHSNPSNEQHSLDTIPPNSSCPTSSFSLLDQQQPATTLHQRIAMDDQSLEMPCLRERGLFALPTDGDGKDIPAWCIKRKEYALSKLQVLENTRF